MDQSVEIPKFYQPKFTSDMELLAQKMEALLRPFVSEKPYQGESGEVVKQFGATKARYGDEDRNGDTPVMTLPRDQRWVYPATADAGDLFSRTDLLRMLVDPTMEVKKAMMAAMNRSIDADVIIPAFFGPAKTGKNGATTTNYPSDGSLDVAITVGSADNATNTGLNTAKLIAARKLFRKNYVDIAAEPITVAISSTQEEDLLNDIKATKSNYNGGDPVLKEGIISRWLGFNFVVLEELPFDPANPTYRWNPAWVKSGMHLGVWNNLNAYYAQDPTKKFNYRVYLEQMFGATRTQEKKVVRIINLDNG